MIKIKILFIFLIILIVKPIIFAKDIDPFIKNLAMDAKQSNYIDECVKYKRNSKYYKAIQSCKKALKIRAFDSKMPYINFLIGSSYYDLKNYNNAIKYLKINTNNLKALLHKKDRTDSSYILKKKTYAFLYDYIC